MKYYSYKITSNCYFKNFFIKNISESSYFVLNEEVPLEDTSWHLKYHSL